MARYDKYDPVVNGYRADIAANFPDVNLGKIYGVGHDAAGKLVIGAGTSGVKGILILTQKPGRVGPLRDVARVDVMVHGCVTDFGPTAGVPGTDFGTPGQDFFSDAAGLISVTPAVGSTYIGHCNEADRLEVNVIPIPLIATQFGV